MSLCVLILTHNEEQHIERCLRSLVGVAERVVIVDSGSDDETVRLARAHGAEVLHRPWVNYATQFQWGLDNAAISQDWIMRLDADEYLDETMRQALREQLGETSHDVGGLLVNRKLVFMGRFIRWGGRQPQWNLRIWRSGLGRIEDRWMDEHIILEGGRIGRAEGAIVDENLNDIAWWTDKHNRYAAREMIDILNSELRFLDGAIGGGESLDGAAGAQADAARTGKESYYQRLPLFLRPLLYFLFRYVVQLGVLDGREGAIYHVLQGFWYRFLVDVKVLEARRLLRGVEDPAEVRRVLSAGFGLQLEQPCVQSPCSNAEEEG